MVCLLVGGVVLSELGLAGLRVRRVLPPAVHAGTPYLMGIALENRKRRLPSFSIEVEDLIDGRPIEKRCYFLKLPAGRVQETAYRNTMAQRGRYRLSGFRLATKFPFGLLPRARAIADVDELYVYPALLPAPETLVRGLPAHPAPGAIVRAQPSGRVPRACAPTGMATIRATSTGVRARAGASRWYARKKMRRRARPRSCSTTSRARPPTRRRSSARSRRRRACASSWRAGASASGLAVRGGEVRPAIGGAQTERILRALAVIAPDAGPLPPVRAGTVVRIRPGAAPALEAAPGAPTSATARMRRA